MSPGKRITLEKKMVSQEHCEGREGGREGETDREREREEREREPSEQQLLSTPQ